MVYLFTVRFPEEIRMVGELLARLQILMHHLTQLQVVMLLLYNLAAQQVHSLDLPDYQQIHVLVSHLLTIQKHTLCILPQVNTLEVVLSL